MSTHALLALSMPDQTVATCHFDGYLRGVGKILDEHYKDPDKIRTIFEPGLRLDRLHPDGTPAFLEEAQEPIQMHATLFRRYPPDLAQAFIYHFHRGAWWVLCGNHPTAEIRWQLLSDALAGVPAKVIDHKTRVMVAITQLMISEVWYNLPEEDRRRLYDVLDDGEYPEIDKDVHPGLLQEIDAERAQEEGP